MVLNEVIQVVKDLLAQKKAHTEKASFYQQLFNAHFADGIATMSYTAVQQFYQRMVQHHMAEVFRIEAALEEFQDIADV